MRVSLVLIAIAVALPSTGCEFLESIFDDDRYVGHVAFGFEVSAFHPCGSDEQWWIAGGGDALLDLQDRYWALGLNPYEMAFAELEGLQSGKGEYGHLNAYQREFRVLDVRDVRLPADGDCGD
jgi:hypothetical protein